VIFLDTHVVVWLYAGELELFSERGRSLLEKNELAISPLVKLELQYLREIKKIKVEPKKIIDALVAELGLVTQDMSLTSMVTAAIEETWTRDPFDRFLVAQARICDCPILSRDREILKNYSAAVW